MNKNIKFSLNLINKLIYITTLIISTWFIFKMFKLNIIPFKYMISSTLILILILIILAIFIFLKKFNYIFKIVSNILSIIIIIFIIIFNNYIIHTDKFIDSIKEKDYILKAYYVLSLEANKYKSLDNFKTIGVYEKDEDYNNALKQVVEKFNLKTNSYDNFEHTSKSLFDKKEDIILIDSIDRGVLLETIIDYDKNTTILSTIYVKKEAEKTTIEYEPAERPFNLFISGIDVSGDISTVSRSDVNMIVTVNPKTHEILLTSIPRDYYVELYGKNDKDKLTHAGIYGINTSVKTVENFLNIDIKYYLKVNFSTLIKLVDLIDGIDVYSDKTFTTRNDENCNVKEGNNHFNGKCALAFSRERHAYKEGDRHRILNQQDVLMAILNKTFASKDLLNKYFDILDILGESFQSNMPREKIYQLINMQLNNMSSWNIKTYSLNGEDSYNYTYSYKRGKLYVMEPSIDTIKEANKKISELINK